MNPVTLEQIRSITGAQRIGDPATPIQSITTNSEKINLASLFIALKGDVHDGHDFIPTAIANGAVAVLVHENCPVDAPILKVTDTRKAMGKLGAFVRQSLRGKVIAVAGSNGKTGTKNLIHSVLKGTRTGTISPKSFNNDVGVPLTIFDADPSHDYLVLEVGTNHHGEILNLTQIARPDVAVITNIGAEHLEFLGDLDGVTRENAQIIEGLNPNGLLIINGDSPHLLEAVAAYPGKKITFGFGTHNDLYPTDIVCDNDGVHFRLKGTPISIPLMGRHTAVNALAAISVARYLAVSDASIIAGLANAQGPEMRLQLQAAGSIRILNDAYNANPHSMQAALETLRDMHATGRKIAILGDMRELGPSADQYHREIGQFAATCGLDHLICVGEKSNLIAAAAIKSGMTVEHYGSATECAADISQIVSEDDLVLLKASRGMKLETVAAAITTYAASEGLQRAIAARMKNVIQRTPSATAV